MAVFKRGKTWWYNFIFAGRHVQKSAKTTSKTLAQAREYEKRKELESALNSPLNNPRRTPARWQTSRPSTHWNTG